jgi:hypothetical protein
VQGLAFKLRKKEKERKRKKKITDIKPNIFFSHASLKIGGDVMGIKMSL